jgi:hypothetical protein
MNNRNFQKCIEDFVCKACNRQVKGNGYTNHCPNCLFSLHCDINPGDREETCGGLMEPIAVSLKDGERLVVQRCKKCGIERNNRLAPNDNVEAVFRLPVVDYNQLKRKR